jgi:hypothetical protein
MTPLKIKTILGLGVSIVTVSGLFAFVIEFVSKVIKYTGQGKRHDHLGNKIE